MSWLSRLFGKDTKTIGVDDLSDHQTNDETYELAWRNRYLAARTKYLTEQHKKKNFGDVSDFNLPQDIQSGGKEHLTTINQNLAARVGYLEDVLKAR
jgi:hypothetical protein